ncbi:MAG: tetratricopeptide repeat protein [Alphaproteobacteria bacterium]
MAKFAWIGVWAVMAGLPPAVHAAPASVLIAEVQAALDKGDATQAANLAETGLKDAGPAEHGRLLLYRGLARELLGDTDAAVSDFTLALTGSALPPEERAQALLQRGFLRDGLGKLEAATADYTAVIAMKGDSLATALNNRANIYRRQNRMMEARRDYLAALAAGGGKPQYSYYGLGQVAEALHDTLTARSSYARALAADPDYSLAAQRLAALGGAPEGTLADPDRVTLRAPSAAPAPNDAARGFKVATEASKEADGTIVLRPPRARSARTERAESPPTDDIVLRPPGAKPRPVAARNAPPPLPLKKPALRPALDQRSHVPVAANGPEVQLGAWRSQAEADAGWDKARAKAPGLLGPLSPHVVTVDLPERGRYYRLRVSPPAGQSQKALCDSLVAAGLACIPIRD